MENNAIQSFLDASHEPSDLRDSRQHRPTCCCGSDSCAYLRNNQTALEVLERDVRTAAKLGQALLVRHETYIADSEQERNRLMAQVETLEMDKVVLERKNASITEENNHLLDQLEAVNNAVSESDARVISLQAALLSTQQQMQRLSYLASRTEWLEQQLADYEQEQATWHTSLEAKETAEKSAVRRWQKAERTLAELHDQIERIESEAKQERERHAEIMARVERKHAVETELMSAAGRLKGAAALKATAQTPPASSTSVVSHFVKDILQDNANLQMGIVELRELLQNSNDEVENLRNQLLEHQPANHPDRRNSQTAVQKDLDEEMGRAASQELHVHHHYHAAPNAPPPPTPAKVMKRPRRKRYGGGTSSGNFTPPSGFGSPRSSISYQTPSAAATILQQTAVSVPQPISATNRWSAQSAQTTYSMSGPSSPRSVTNRTSSIYDRVWSDAGIDSSRPTTPETEDPGSPVVAPSHAKRSSISSIRSRSTPIVQRSGASPAMRGIRLDAITDEDLTSLPTLEPRSGSHEAIPEETEVDWEESGSSDAVPDLGLPSITTDLSSPLDEPNYYEPVLRRAASHESLLSVSGMDIHTLKSRPSQLLLPYGARPYATRATTSEAQAHVARPVAMSRASDISSVTLLSGMAAEPRRPDVRPSLGSKVGGWVFSRWGASPASATSTSSTATPSVVPSSDNASFSSGTPSEERSLDSQATPKKPPPPPPVAPRVRAPGINQPGPIFGFSPEVRRPVLPPVMKSLDEEALKTALHDQSGS